MCAIDKLDPSGRRNETVLLHILASNVTKSDKPLTCADKTKWRGGVSLIIVRLSGFATGLIATQISNNRTVGSDEDSFLPPFGAKIETSSLVTLLSSCFEYIY